MEPTPKSDTDHGPGQTGPPGVNPAITVNEPDKDKVSRLPNTDELTHTHTHTHTYTHTESEFVCFYVFFFSPVLSQGCLEC